MTLDNQEQQAILLQLLDQAQFQGSAVEAVYSLKRALTSARIQGPNEQEVQASRESA